MRPSRTIFLSLLLLAVPLASLAQADRAVETSTLPSPRWGAAAVFTGSEVLVFGGWGINTKNDIIRVDTATGEATVAKASLPAGVAFPSVVWTGTDAIIFGEITGHGATILHYDPAADAVTPTGIRLTGAYQGTAAVWTGEVAYLFGGHSCWWTDGEEEGHFGCTRILRYDPATRDLSLVGRLPVPMERHVAVWTGKAAYLFGGCHGRNSCDNVHREIYRFDPDTLGVEKLNAILPGPTTDASGVWTGERVLLFGVHALDGVDRALAFDPATHSFTWLSAELEGGVDLRAAAWDGHRAWLAGGIGCNSPAESVFEYVESGGDMGACYLSDAVVRYDVAPAAPQALLALPVPGGGVQLAWTAPAENTYVGEITGYTVWRDGVPVAAHVQETSWVDDDCDGVCAYEVAATSTHGDSERASMLAGSLGNL